MKHKSLLGLLLFVALLLTFSLIAKAEAGERMPDEYGEMGESLPDEVRDGLPSELWSESAREVEEALRVLLRPREVFSRILAHLSENVARAVGLLGLLCSLTVLTGIFSHMRRSLSSEGLSRAVGYCGTCVLLASVLGILYEEILSVSAYFDRLVSLVAAMIPVTGTLYAMGGNVGTASVSGATLYAFLGVCQGFFAKSVPVVCGVLSALAVTSSLCPGIRLRGLVEAIKKGYSFTLGLVMTVLISVLSAQTTLAAASDSTAARAAKAVSGTVIPLVGGSVGESLRTVAAGVGYLKSVVGILGICLLFWLLLPTLLSLLLSRLAFLLSASIAESLGCEEESRLMSEIGHVYACMVAAVSAGGVMFILAMTIFVRCAVALG